MTSLRTFKHSQEILGFPDGLEGFPVRGTFGLVTQFPEYEIWGSPSSKLTLYTRLDILNNGCRQWQAHLVLALPLRLILCT